MKCRCGAVKARGQYAYTLSRLYRLAVLREIASGVAWGMSECRRDSCYESTKTCSVDLVASCDLGRFRDVGCCPSSDEKTEP